ncbi:hypothetical protein HN031_16520 [Nocardioides sp. zg-1308]|uniref:hypothetical protein n=1 Tax=Nocardioides sp. zg-1308 TaxID=2736253 RepID=UPI0015570C3E|nr:hypothetical protein [Nocardioides sp. zg-1308]NPD06285.1 hypothetical protein [Nocardioides sp. zg-1308]
MRRLAFLLLLAALADEAPGDIADDWAAVIDPLRDLRQVLADHGVDASSYARKPPVGLDRHARRTIEAAARRVGSARAVEAMAALEHHARDVCGTPLSR